MEYFIMTEKFKKKEIIEVLEEMEWYRGYFSNSRKRTIQFTIEKYSEQIKKKCMNQDEKADFILQKLNNKKST